MLRLSIAAAPSKIGIVGRNAVMPAIVEPHVTKGLDDESSAGHIDIREPSLGTLRFTCFGLAE
jgi:hypothetical protein